MISFHILTIKNLNKVISKNAMSWVENSKDWMILAQGLKLLEKLSNSDGQILKSNVISIARQLKNDERKAVRSQAQKNFKKTPKKTPKFSKNVVKLGSDMISFLTIKEVFLKEQ